jgi:hypothetical protein
MNINLVWYRTVGRRKESKMAWNLEMSSKLRPCYIYFRKDKTKKALFHCWSPNGTKMNEGTVGIVELENGEVATVVPECLRFADSMFDEYTWE